MINFDQAKKLLVTTSTVTTNKNGDPVTYVTVLGDDFKTTDIYLKGKHDFEPNKSYNFFFAYFDNPWKYLGVNKVELAK